MPTKIQSCLSKMPALRHSVEGEVFDIRQSAALRWVLEQPTALQWIWDRVRGSGAVEYSPESGEWRGVEPGVVQTGGRPAIIDAEVILSVIREIAPGETLAVTRSVLLKAVRCSTPISESSLRNKLLPMLDSGTVNSKLLESGVRVYWAASSPAL